MNDVDGIKFGEEPSLYEQLSQQNVAKLHLNYMKSINDRAESTVEQHIEAREDIVEKLTYALLWADRCRLKLSNKDILEMAEEGVEGLNEHIWRLENQYRNDPWSLYYRAKLNLLFNLRSNPPLVENIFGSDDRIYLKIKEPDGMSGKQIRIAEYLETKGYFIKDYIKGYATDAAGKQQFKIGRLLKGEPKLLDSFKTDEVRTSINKYAVISCNQKDLEMMSTNRAWDSCMASDGNYRSKVPATVGSKTLVAYLISENDPEISDPLARILLKPYDCRTSVKKKSEYQTSFMPSPSAMYKHWKDVITDNDDPITDQSVVYMVDAMYGLGTTRFRQVVQEFVDTQLNNPMPGHEYMLYGNVYPDGLPRFVKLEDGKLVTSFDFM